MKLNHFKIEKDKIVLKTKEPLADAITKEFTEYSTEKGDNSITYFFEIMPNMSFAIRALLAKYKVFTADKDVLLAIYEKTKYATMPILSLYSTGKHVEIQCPPLDYYLKLMDAVGASNKGMNTYTIPIARAYDIIRTAQITPTFLPKFAISKNLRDVMTEPIENFDGTLASLFKSPIRTLKAASSAYRVPIENFNNVGYESVADFLFTQPRKYIDKTKITSFEDIEPKEPITLIGKIVDKKLVYYKHAQFVVEVAGKMFECMYYHRSWMETKFSYGDEVLIMGEYQGNGKINGTSMESLVEALALDIVPIYSQSSKNNITSKIVLNVVYEAIERIKPHIDNLLPYINQEEMDMTLGEAIREMHFPTSSESYIGALECLALYELVFLQLMILDRKANEVKDKGLPKPYRKGGYFDAMVESLPWELTDAQNEGLKKMNDYMSSVTSEQVLLSADVGSGKGLRENELIATPTGWKKMKDISVGDYVIGRSGKPVKVIGVYPQGKQELAKITFNDKVEVVTDMEHRWTVSPINESEEYVISTADLLNNQEKTIGIIYQKESNGFTSVQSKNINTYYQDSNGSSKWKIPLLENPVEYEGEQLPVEAYNSTSVLDEIQIPEIYMTATADERLSLLQGIIDYFGSISEDGSIHFSHKNKNIVDNVVELAQSLGGVAWNEENEAKIFLPQNIKPCRLGLKLEQYENSKNNKELIRSIEKVEKLDYKENTICIKVDAEDENFVIKNYVVTHNTVIAQLSCMQALDNGYQSVLAAPTEVLAEQLYSTFEKIVESMPDDKKPTIAFLGGKLKAKERNEILKYVKSGDIQILIGTHAVLNKKLEFRNLGLIVIDEQQKFGKAQREALLESRSDGLKPDLLAQTATPIPRSTAQAFYGDIDLISLFGKPKGRIEIVTKWVKEPPKLITKNKNHEMWKDIMNEVEKGHQVFVVVPMVYESKKMDSASVEGAYKDLKKTLSNARVGFTHGSLKKDEQQKAMDQFRARELDVLVASTVIEVGVDVPNATRIVVLSADRLGASSLHQIRGRVGRGNLESTCYLVSEGKTNTSQKRLQALVDSTDGFEIAKVDLETRGQGDLFGDRQAGDSTFLRFSNLVDHSKLVAEAQKFANKIYESSYKERAIKDAHALLGKEEEILL